MYYYLVSALKRRLVLELQDSFKAHPIYSKLVPYIQNKNSFDERPQFGIVIKGSSANKVALSGDNFIGTVQSHVMLGYVGKPTYPIEWVREDLLAIQNNKNTFPTLPGAYYIEILSVPDSAQDVGTFIVDPLLTISSEPLLRFVSGIEKNARLRNVPVSGTLRLWENNRILLTENVDYQVDYKTGAILFLVSFGKNSLVTADYRSIVPSIGPVTWKWNTSDSTTLPGVVLAFGKRASVGDKVVVVIYPDRVDTANAYGGKFELSFDMDVISQDSTQLEEIADLVIMYLWGHRKPVLESEGIEITDISMGGEAEETYDETAEIPVYTASISVSMRADWEVHFPLTLTISKVTPAKSSLDPTSAVVNGIPSNLFFATAPELPHRNHNYERIT